MSGPTTTVSAGDWFDDNNWSNGAPLPPALFNPTVAHAMTNPTGTDIVLNGFITIQATGSLDAGGASVTLGDPVVIEGSVTNCGTLSISLSSTQTSTIAATAVLDCNLIAFSSVDSSATLDCTAELGNVAFAGSGVLLSGHDLACETLDLGTVVMSGSPESGGDRSIAVGTSTTVSEGGSLLRIVSFSCPLVNATGRTIDGWTFATPATVIGGTVQSTAFQDGATLRNVTAGTGVTVDGTARLEGTTSGSIAATDLMLYGPSADLTGSTGNISIMRNNTEYTIASGVTVKSRVPQYID